MDNQQEDSDTGSVSSSESCAQAEHTSGPWEDDLKPLDGVDGRSILSQDKEGNFFVVATVNVPAQGLLEGDWRANAQLIAAAPNLLSAAKRMLDAVQSNDPAEPEAQRPDSGAVMSLKGAIAKAEGEA